MPSSQQDRCCQGDKRGNHINAQKILLIKMFIVLFKRKVLFNSYLIPFKGKEGVEEIFLYKDEAGPFSPINIITYLELSSFSFHSVFSPMGNYKGSKLGTTSLLIHISILCTIWMVCILRKSVLWTGWESLSRNWSSAFSLLQKSASGNLPNSLQRLILLFVSVFISSTSIDSQSCL